MTRPPQSLHIFRKDLLHLWPETLVVVLLFVAFAWTASSAWLHTQAAIASTLLGGFLKIFLMPVSWLVVITRLIQDESLVGDRQFWTSRPYHWAKLLAAKLLYLFVFLYVPFFLMQVFLLKHAGLYPTLALPALLKNLLLLTVIIVIPLAAIAAVTSTFARMLLSTVGAIIYLLIVSLGVVYLLLRRMPPPGLEYFLYGLIILLPFARPHLPVRHPQNPHRPHRPRAHPAPHRRAAAAHPRHRPHPSCVSSQHHRRTARPPA